MLAGTQIDFGDGLDELPGLAGKQFRVARTEAEQCDARRVHGYVEGHKPEFAEAKPPQIPVRQRSIKI
jgi:hypothetical protein